MRWVTTFSTQHFATLAWWEVKIHVLLCLIPRFFVRFFVYLLASFRDIIFANLWAITYKNYAELLFVLYVVCTRWRLKIKTTHWKSVIITIMKLKWLKFEPIVLKKEKFTIFYTWLEKMFYLNQLFNSKFLV